MDLRLLQEKWFWICCDIYSFALVLITSLYRTPQSPFLTPIALMHL